MRINSVKKAALLILSFLAFNVSNAQFDFMTLGQQLGFGDTLNKQQNQQKTPTPKANTDAKNKSNNKKVDGDTINSKGSLKESLNSTQDVRKDTIVHQWIMILNSLEKKGEENWNKTDKMLYSMTSKNLELLLEKDHLLLKNELKDLKKGEKNLPASNLYGHSFFRSNTTNNFNQIQESVPTANYVLGTGDVVQIDVWGYSNFSANEEVDQNGSIKLPNNDRVFLKGKTLIQAKKIIGARIGRMVNLRNSDYSVVVTKTKNIIVHITGEVFKPGTYTISANNTLYNALVRIGGPNNLGSVRQIYLKRGGKVIDNFDLYAYLKSPLKSKEIYLQDNDYIVVPVQGKVVSIAGSVKSGGRFELKKDEKLKDLIQFSAGLKPTTYLKNITLVRIEDNTIYKTYNINYDSILKRNGDVGLMDGDSISFKDISKDNMFTVSLEGAINIPGEYKIKKGDKISDVLRRANGPVYDADLKKGYIVRKNKDLTLSYINFSVEDVINNIASESNHLLQVSDIVHIFSKNEQNTTFKMSISGSVKNPKRLPFANNTRISDIIQMANGLKVNTDSTKGHIIRTNADLSRSYIGFSAKSILLDVNSKDNVFLKPKDEVRLYSKEEQFIKYEISVNGAVKKPGKFNYTNNTRISDLVDMANGFEEKSYKNTALLVRTNLKTLEKNAIHIDLKKVISSKNSKENIFLQPKDELTIFTKENLVHQYEVKVFGEVDSSISIEFNSGITLKDAIIKSGGIKKEAETSLIEIISYLKKSDDGFTWVPMKPMRKTISIDKNMLLNDNEPIYLNAGDRIFIRKNPYTKKVRTVTLKGAVKYEGIYDIKDENETISEIIKRAGGLMPFAFSEGTELYRGVGDDKKVRLVLNLNKAIRRKHSKYNYVVKDQDEIFIPETDDIVLIEGVYGVQTNPKTIGVHYNRGRRAKYYIKKYAGGFKKGTSRKNTTVEYADGSIRKAKHYGLFIKYPKPRVGSKIKTISREEIKKKKKSKVTLDALISGITSKLMSFVLIFALIKSLGF